MVRKVSPWDKSLEFVSIGESKEIGKEATTIARPELIQKNCVLSRMFSAHGSVRAIDTLKFKASG